MKRAAAILIAAIMILSAAGCAASESVSVVGANIDGSGHLVLSMSDGSTLDAGMAKGEQGAQGMQGEQGVQGEKGADGQNGTDGVGIQKAAVNDNGHLMVRLTDGTLIDTGYVVGADGADGADGTNGVNGVNGLNGRDGADGSDGSDGASGADGANGLTPHIGENGNWWIGEEDTGVKAGQDDFIFNCDGYGSTLLAYVGSDEYITLPEKTQWIANGAFRNNSVVHGVSCNKDLNGIGEYAFSGCLNLYDIHFNDECDIQYIGQHAFEQSPIMDFILPNSSTLRYVEDNTFYKCSNLSVVTLPETVEQIGAYAFYECYNLQSVTNHQGTNLEHIGEYAFTQCYQLKTMPVLPLSIGQFAFNNCARLSDVSFRDSSSFPYSEQIYFANSAFENSAITKVDISLAVPTGVTSIAIMERAFFNANALTSFSITTDASIGSIGLSNNSLCGGSLETVNIQANNCDCIYINERAITGNQLSQVNIAASKSPSSGPSIILNQFSIIGYGGDDSHITLDGVVRMNGWGYDSQLGAFKSSVIGFYSGNLTLDIYRFYTEQGESFTFHAVKARNIAFIYRNDDPSGMDNITNLFHPEPTNIYVPAGYVDAYKSASGWSAYADIIQAIPVNP